MTSQQRVTRVVKKIGPLRLAVTTGMLLIAIFVWGFLISGKLQAQEVISSSMAPTVQKGDRLIVASIEESKNPLLRGDIVTVMSQSNDGFPLLKRIVALPGDEVYIVEQEVFVNEKPTQELLEERGLGGSKFQVYYKLKEDEYLVIGDNRKNSFDSLQFGPVSREEIIGKMLFRYAPFNRVGVPE